MILIYVGEKQNMFENKRSNKIIVFRFYFATIHSNYLRLPNVYLFFQTVSFGEDIKKNPRKKCVRSDFKQISILYKSKHNARLPLRVLNMKV